MYTEKCQQTQKYNQAAHLVIADRILVPLHFREFSYHETQSIFRVYYTYTNSVKRSPSLESCVRFQDAIVKCKHSLTKL